MNIKAIEKSLSKKDFIVDDGVIRSCLSNLAKMNLTEYMYCKHRYWDGLYNWGGFKDALIGMWEGLQCLAIILITILTIPLSPIIISIVCAKQLSGYKKDLEEQKREEQHI